MSTHWKPPGGKIVRIRPVGDWTNGGGTGGPRAPVTVLISAVFVGIVAGAILAAPESAQRVVGFDAAPVAASSESFIPEAKAEPADAEWAARGSSAYRYRHSGAAARAVHASFSYCKWGGGTNCVVDGDTFYIGGAKVRIADIDAPETHDYRCGKELELGERAARDLQALLNSGAVTMTSIDRDRDVYGRLLRNVSVNGRDVGEALVAAGVARPWEGHRRPWC